MNIYFLYCETFFTSTTPCKNEILQIQFIYSDNYFDICRMTLHPSFNYTSNATITTTSSTTAFATIITTVTTATVFLQFFPFHPVIHCHYSCRSSGQYMENYVKFDEKKRFKDHVYFKIYDQSLSD